VLTSKKNHEENDGNEPNVAIHRTAKGEVLLRADFKELASQARISRVLRQLTTAGGRSLP
jgi:hypothetical protein